MASMLAVHFALRARAVQALVCTTGSTTLAAIATGYTRASGSFVTDQFTVGQEIQPTGFTDTTPRIVSGVSALTLTVEGTVSAESALSGRSLYCGLYALRAWENLAFEPTNGRPFVEEDFQHLTTELVAGPAEHGLIEQQGLYHLKLYGLSNKGSNEIRLMAEAVYARFTPGTFMAVGSDVVRVRGDVGPYTNQIFARDDGWSVLTLTIPWSILSTNAIAA